MTPQEALSQPSAGCVASMNNGEIEALKTLAAIKWIEYNQTHFTPVSITVTVQQALSQAGCVTDLSWGTHDTIQALSALAQL